MKGRTLALVIGAVSLVALAAMFGVSRATAATSMHRGSASAESRGTGCNRLMSDPAAVKAMQPLHAEHVQDMQAWQDRYGADAKSPEAKAAFRAMSREHVREMRAAFKKLGIKIPAGTCTVGMMDGASSGTGMMGGDATGMMGGSGAATDVHQQHHGTGGAGSDGASTMMGGATNGMMGGAF